MKPSFRHSLRAVAWSFFGIRKGSEFQRDVTRINPLHVVLAGFVGVALFVGTLVGIVNWVAAK